MYIGLKDKHGNKIFTGDIFSGGFDGDPRIVEWGEPEASFYVYDNGNTHYFLSSINPENEEVVGNIHDNPELFTT